MSQKRKKKIKIFGGQKIIKSSLSKSVVSKRLGNTVLKRIEGEGVVRLQQRFILELQYFYNFRFVRRLTLPFCTVGIL